MIDPFVAYLQKFIESMHIPCRHEWYIKIYRYDEGEIHCAMKYWQCNKCSKIEEYCRR